MEAPLHQPGPASPGDRGDPPSTGREGDAQTAPPATSGRPSRGRLPLDDRGERTPPPPPGSLAAAGSQPSLDRGLPPAVVGVPEGDGADPG